MTAKIDKKYEAQILAQIPLGEPARHSVVSTGQLVCACFGALCLSWTSRLDLKYQTSPARIVCNSKHWQAPHRPIVFSWLAMHLYF